MKGRAKLLHFLAIAPAKVEPMLGAPAGGGDMLVRPDGARLLTAQLAPCVSEGLIARGETVALTPPGRAWLRRHEARHVDAPFARQHQVREAATVEREAVVVNRDHSPLSRLAFAKDRTGRPWIDREGLEAGERFARDFELGGLRQRVTSSWDPTPRSSKSGAGGQAELGDSAIDARSRLEKAQAWLGPDLSGVALDICCFAKGTSQVERDRRWPPRSAKLMLRTALDLLARHYGLRTGYSERAERTRSWRSA